MALFERPGVSEEDSRRFFDGEEGLVDAELLAVCAREERASLAPGVELATVVTMRFKSTYPEQLGRALQRDGSLPARALRARSAEFDWSPIGLNGKASPCGAVVLRGATVSAEAVSLTHGARLCASLKRLADGALELVHLERRPIDGRAAAG